MWLYVWMGFINCKVVCKSCLLCWGFHSYSRDSCKQSWTLSCSLSHTWIAYPRSDHLPMEWFVCVHFLWDPFLTFLISRFIKILSPNHWQGMYQWTQPQSVLLWVCSSSLIISSSHQFFKIRHFFCFPTLGWLPTVPCSGAGLYWQMHNSVVCTLHLLTMAPKAEWHNSEAFA